MNSNVQIKLEAWWQLDSRSFPTVSCKTSLINEDGEVVASAVASVPSGASTGTHEALELRDNDLNNFAGKGVEKAINNIVKMGKEISELYFENPIELDKFLIEKDGTENKNNLGANCILGISMSAHRAFANLNNLELWQYLGYLYFNGENNNLEKYPKLMCNIINGGAHADSGLSFQEFMVIPNTGSVIEDVQAASEMYIALKSGLKKANQSTALGDEGGFAPHLSGTLEAIDFIVNSVKNTKYNKDQYSIAFDCAASEYYNAETDKYLVDGKEYDYVQLAQYLIELSQKYNIESIEDAFAEDDIKAWQNLKEIAGDKFCQIGDDLFVTNVNRFTEFGLGKNCGSGVLIKLNQIGSVYETCKMINLAHENNYETAISHRSGETNDSFISDLAVASGAKYIKLGAPARGERVAKYNRLIEIYKDL